MTNTRDFLLEIGTEELPPMSLQTLSLALAKQINHGLQQAALPFNRIQQFVTPRRLAILVQGLAIAQPTREIKRKGPSLDAAYDKHGKPTAACMGFARSCGVDIDQLDVEQDNKNKWLMFHSKATGEETQSLLPKIIDSAIAALPIARPMRWGNHQEEFVRPIHWIVMIFGNDIIQAEILGHKAGRETFGHRFHYPEALSINAPHEYVQLLKKHKVLVDFNERQQVIREQTNNVSDNQAIIGEALLEEVTGLVEWPVALKGKFSNQFLELPKEVIICVMKTHQRCFPLVVNDKLQPQFITICNIESKDPQRVITGNERVIHARLSDAQFFYHTDLRHSLESRLEALKPVIFQAKLGSLYDKVERVKQLAKFISITLNADAHIVERAALLAKSDLMTEMVVEFPELQGIMGYYYALQDKEDKRVAIAIKEHYYPRFSGDALPTSIESCSLAIADKIDTLIGIFGIRQAPTGERDPFALRRAALGILRICIEKQLPLDLQKSLTQAAKLYQTPLPNNNVVNDALVFMLERLRALYAEQNISPDVFAAVMACQPTKPLDFDRRIKAVQYFQNLPEAKALTTANKRVNNILKKQGDGVAHQKINPSLFAESAEKVLAQALEEKIKITDPLYQQADYTKCLTELAGLREPIDNFFDQVMVMVDDHALRDNRLALLHRLRSLFAQIADISLLQS